MPEQSVNGIVIRRKDSGESDRRLTLLTQEKGKVDVLAKGARKAASRLNGATEPFTCAVFCLASGAKGRTFILTQAQLTSSFRGLRADFDRLSLGLALVELFAYVLPYEEETDEAYQLLRSSLQALEAHPKPVVASVWSQMNLLELSGVLPQFLQCVICGVQLRFAEEFVSVSAGGFVCRDHAATYSDREPIRLEVLIGLGKILLLASPPENLKFAEQCLMTLAPFWRGFADSALPANEALIRHLHTERLAGS